MLNNTKWDTPTTPSELMRRAADIMEERGKAVMAFIVLPTTADIYKTDQKMGSMCIQGALMSALGEADDNIGHYSDTMLEPIYQKAMDILHSEAPKDEFGRRSVVAWNNDRNVTKEEVVAKLRDTADRYVLEPA